MREEQKILQMIKMHSGDKKMMELDLTERWKEDLHKSGERASEKSDEIELKRRKWDDSDNLPSRFGDLCLPWSSMPRR